MIFKLLALPLRIVFFILAAFLFPRFLRWIFRLPWVVYIALAAGAGYFAFQEYNTFQANVVRADAQIAQGIPPATPLSKWDRASDVGANDEVNVQGIYFAGLPTGTFTSVGLNYAFVLLADDQGREVKAVLVVRPDDLPALQRRLAQQDARERTPVTVNGTYTSNSFWYDAVRDELRAMNAPMARNIVIIEPFMTPRAEEIMTRAQDTIGAAVVLGALAGLLAFWGLIRLLVGVGRKSSATQSQKSARQVQAERQAKQPSQKARPTGNAPEASPWGTFKPQTRPNGSPDPTSASRMVKPQSPNQPKPQTKSKAPPKDAPAPQPEFESVFPGGGSGFRFKSADEIIRQSFGTLSSLQPIKRDD